MIAWGVIEDSWKLSVIAKGKAKLLIGFTNNLSVSASCGTAKA